MTASVPLVQTLETCPVAPWGWMTHLKVYTPGYRRLAWLEVWQALQSAYPGRWALELYPPAEALVNDAHVYHLWLLPEEWTLPVGLNLAEKYRG